MSGVQYFLVLGVVFGLFHSSFGQYCGNNTWQQPTSYIRESLHAILPAGQQLVPLNIYDGHLVCPDFVGETVIACDYDVAPIVETVIDPLRAIVNRRGSLLVDGYAYVDYYCLTPGQGVAAPPLIGK